MPRRPSSPSSTSSSEPIIEMITMAACRSLLQVLPKDGQVRVLTWLAGTLGARPDAREVLPDLNKELRRVVAEAVKAGERRGPAPVETKAPRGAPKIAKKKARGGVRSAITRARNVTPVPIEAPGLGEFLEKNPAATQAELVTVLARYLAQQGTPNFMPRQLVALDRAAGGKGFTNISVALRQAADKGQLKRNDDGTWSLLGGEAGPAAEPAPAQ